MTLVYGYAPVRTCQDVMPRADRLFRLLTAFRMLPQPVTAARLAEETGVSERTLYRDIQSLRAAGALIDGEAGAGYTLTEDPALPKSPSRAIRYWRKPPQRPRPRSSPPCPTACSARRSMP
jgi:biotin operon repressor